LTDFTTLGVAEALTTQLAALNITSPTPIQTQAIPLALAGEDVMGLAQTGTGKTAAFGLPLVQTMLSLGTRPGQKQVGALVLAPTRELARQITDALRGFARGRHLRIDLVTGGVSINKQIQSLSRGTHILVATPGRLIDLLDRRAVSLTETRFLVLDEADQMLDMGFIHALRRIAPLLPKERQTMLFSATMPKQMEELAQAYLTNPKRVQVANPGQTADKITQSVHFVEQGDKFTLLKKLLGAHRSDRSLVFSRTKHGAERLMKNLVKAGFDAASIHGNKSQGQRDRAISDFKSGKIMVLVATDVAARGIDIPGVEYVYNHDLPNVAENYVHRIGRTARAGASGQAVAFCAPAETGELRDIEKTIGIKLPVAGGTPWTKEQAPDAASKRPGGRPQRRRSGRRPRNRQKAAA